MPRLLRLLTLCLLALALPLQGFAAVQGMAGGGAARHEGGSALPTSMVMHPTVMAMAMPGMAAAADDAALAAPCPHHDRHDAAKPACGACCGPAVVAGDVLAVAPIEARALPALRHAPRARAPQFLTDGLDRPPRRSLA